MKEPKIFPLVSAGKSGPCARDRCAWFCLEYHQDGDYTDGKCALVRIADALTSNSQPFGNLDKKTAAGAANTDGGKGTQQDH